MGSWSTGRGAAIRLALEELGISSARIQVQVVDAAAEVPQLAMYALSAVPQASPTRQPKAAPAAAAPPTNSHVQLLDLVRDDFSTMRGALAPKLSLPSPVKLRVQVSNVTFAVAPAEGAQLAICVALGLERVNHDTYAMFTVSDLAVDEVDIELWDVSRACLIGACCMSVQQLLARSETALTDELLVIAYGDVGDAPAGTQVGTLRVDAEVLDLAEAAANIRLS